jgi:voltage-gated potassium channel Kch
MSQKVSVFLRKELNESRPLASSVPRVSGEIITGNLTGSFVLILAGQRAAFGIIIAG